MAKCDACYGTGRALCTKCKGSGEGVIQIGHLKNETDCGRCHGAKYDPIEKCEVCGGSGEKPLPRNET